MLLVDYTVSMSPDKFYKKNVENTDFFAEFDYKLDVFVQFKNQSC